MQNKVTITPVSECAILVRFADVDCDSARTIGLVTELLYQQYEQYIMNITPSVDSLLIDYLPHRMSLEDLIHSVEQTVVSVSNDTRIPDKNCIIQLPVYYAPEVGPDLKRYLEQDIALPEIIDLHTSQIYTVVAVGFAPGFAFMQEVDAKLRLPRHTTPRLSIPKGSVAIADNRTAVYPDISPGGWNVIGNCPIDLYRPTESPMVPYKVGSQVQFFSIDKEQFLSLGGKVSGEFL